MEEPSVGGRIGRRKFLRWGLGLGVVALAAYRFIPVKRLVISATPGTPRKRITPPPSAPPVPSAAPTASPEIPVQLCSVRGGTIADRVRAAFENIGLDSRVTKGTKVVLKVNLLQASKKACNVPEFVGALAKEFLDHGAEVLVADSSSGGSTRQTAEHTGLLTVCGEVGVPFKALEDSERVAVDVPNSLRLSSVNVAKEVMDADLLVSVPKLKLHGQSIITLGMKNMMGTIHRFEMKDFHMDIQSSIADLMRVVPPDVVFVDGTEAMVTGGPMNGRMEQRDLVIAGYDVVAVDAAGSRELDVDPTGVGHIVKAQDAGLGSMEPASSRDLAL